MKPVFIFLFFFSLSSFLLAEKEDKPREEGRVFRIEKSKKTDHFFVLLTFGGQTFKMILDTGAGMSVINQAQVSALSGVDFKDLPAHYRYEGEKKVQMAVVSDMMLEGKSLNAPVQILSMDLEAVLSVYGGEVAGICGLSLFSDKIVLFDWGKRTLTLYDSLPTLPKGAKEWKVKYENLGYYLEGFSYSDKEGKEHSSSFLALLDTGATATMLPRSTWKGEVKKEERRGAVMTAESREAHFTHSHIIENGIAFFPCVGLETPMKLEGFNPFFDQNPEGASSPLGLLGMDVFQKGRLLIEGKSHRVWWLPAGESHDKTQRKSEREAQQN